MFKVLDQSVSIMAPTLTCVIVNIASLHGKVASPFKAAYFSAKDGLFRFDKKGDRLTSHDSPNRRTSTP
jgi:short-subunit dehydrogenase